MERGKIVDLILEGSNVIVVTKKDRWLYANTVGRVKLQSMVFKDYLADTERDVRNCSPYKKQSIKGKKNGIRNRTASGKYGQVASSAT
ncbi:hypothetical protein Peur_047096 [Populus x canadensis]